MFNFPSQCSLYLQLWLTSKRWNYLLRTRETESSHSVTWKRGLNSACYPSWLGGGGGSHTFLGQECPEVNASRSGPSCLWVTMQPPLPENMACAQGPLLFTWNTFPDILPQHFHLISTKHLVGGSLQGNEWQRWDPVDLGPCFLQVAKVIMRGMWTCKWAMERGDRWEESSSWVITNFQWE